MPSLADAKQYLGVSGGDEDALIGRLLTAATDYLKEIGVTVDPEPAPVGEAILLLVAKFYKRRSGDFALRHTEVNDIGTWTYFDPALIDQSDLATIALLTAPYREIAL